VTLTGPENGTEYFIEVYAVDGASESSAAFANGFGATVPNPPQKLSTPTIAVASEGYTSLTATWPVAPNAERAASAIEKDVLKIQEGS